VVLDGNVRVKNTVLNSELLGKVLVTLYTIFLVVLLLQRYCSFGGNYKAGAVSPICGNDPCVGGILLVICYRYFCFWLYIPDGGQNVGIADNGGLGH